MGYTMKLIGRLGSVAFAGLLGLANGVAHADVGVNGHDSVVQPGQIANLNITLDFGNNYGMSGFELILEFDPTLVRFHRDQSSVAIENVGLNRSFQQFFTDDLFGKAFYLHNEGDLDPGYFHYSLYTLTTPLMFSGVVSFNAAFELLGQPPGDAPVPIHVTGSLYDDSFNSQDIDLTLMANPVPEPQEWLLMLAGLSLLAWRGTRGKI